MSVLDKITMGDLDENQQLIAEIVGLDNYKKLVAAYGGMSIYIPKPDQFERADRDSRIRAEFDGYNFRALAQKYGLTEVSIRSIVSGRVREVRARPLDGQLTFQ